jgi:hypothetical protein
VAAIKEQLPGFNATYRPDYRQFIADSWPASIDDLPAREDWGWAAEYDLGMMTRDMLANLKARQRQPEDNYVFTVVEA